MSFTKEICKLCPYRKPNNMPLSGKYTRGERGAVRCGFKPKSKAVPRIAVFVNVKPHIAVSLRYGFVVIFAVSVLNGSVSVFYRKF